VEAGTQEALLLVRSPGREERPPLELSGDRVTVGRLSGLKDIVLDPDPDQLVSRQEHCVLERDGSRWFVVDRGSVNGTYVRRGKELERVAGRTELVDGDALCIIASLSAEGAPSFWELVFDDRGKTRGAPVGPQPACLVYRADQARLLLVRGTDRVEIALRPQTHRLVGFMAGRNEEAGGTPVLCTHDELMAAVWNDEPMHTREELNKLFWELRRKLEPFGADDLFESERGLGYRMRTCPA
jgi:hypothetical protein